MKDNFNKVFVLCFILIGWISVLHLIKSLFLAFHANTGVAPTIVFFTIESIALGILFYSWFNHLNKDTAEATIDDSEPSQEAAIVSHQEVKAEEKKNLYDFTFIKEKSDVNQIYRKLLSQLANIFNAGSGIAYIINSDGAYSPIAAFALPADAVVEDFIPGEGLPGQVVINKSPLVISDLPEKYITIESGLGKCKPASILFIPLVSHNRVISLIEMQSFGSPDMASVTKVFDELSLLLEDYKVTLNL